MSRPRKMNSYLIQYKDEIIKYYTTGGNMINLSKKLNCNVATIYYFIKCLGISKRKPEIGNYAEKWSKKEEEFLINFYGKIPTIDISKQINKTKVAIITKAKRLKLIGNRSISLRKYTLNEDYFSIIDSEEKSYWLGFLYADGNVRMPGKNKGTIDLHLGAKDKSHIEKFLKSINSNSPIRYIKNNNTYRGICCSYKICKDLCNLGCIPAKTFKLKFPNLREDLIKHFIRGYFDGDGCITGSYRDGGCFFLGQIGFLSDLNKIFNNIGLFKSIQSTKDRVLRIAFYSYNNLLTIYHYLYDNSNLYLERKKNKFEEILNCPS